MIGESGCFGEDRCFDQFRGCWGVIAHAEWDMIKFQVLLDGWSYFGLVETGPSSFLIYWNFCTAVLTSGLGAIVLVSFFIQPSSYHISWCLQTCHLFSRLSILCWLLPCNKY